MTKFDQAAFELASAKCFQAAHKIDGVIASANDAKNNWAMLAMAGIVSNKLTIEQVQAQLISDYRLQVLKGDEQLEFDCETATISDCGSTIKGWYYDLKRVVSAGSEQMERVISGESLTSVRRETKPIQKQVKKSSNKPFEVDNKLSLSECITGLAYHVDNAMTNSDLALALASNEQLASLISKLTKLEAKVSLKLAA